MPSYLYALFMIHLYFMQLFFAHNANASHNSLGRTLLLAQLHTKMLLFYLFSFFLYVTAKYLVATFRSGFRCLSVRLAARNSFCGDSLTTKDLH